MKIPSYKTKIKKIGCSYFLIIPSYIIKSHNLKLQEEVNVYLEIGIDLENGS